MSKERVAGVNASVWRRAEDAHPNGPTSLPKKRGSPRSRFPLGLEVFRAACRRLSVRLKRPPPESSQRLLDFATAGDWTTPTCGDRMTARDSKRGPFCGCEKYPKCRGTLPMRASASQ
ncbi:topoisomerase DNA-binding C4 zinc finger domain-containing protein [Aromatoleum diolicum]|uniref:DNA topoisomerase type IA zn finger domain-containing protein n=1 Tax=Aromatoleum diolicum TaxID=75796 RepID=A0ABX1QI57_9RHOO|nr:topoisomerase DNA-binding C4 zinc finger domain-containing protein [Aromatoleum diolicum]NMG77285.1 hypothetical protein [Aromatoleum diolicum]